MRKNEKKSHLFLSVLSISSVFLVRLLKSTARDSIAQNRREQRSKSRSRHTGFGHRIDLFVPMRNLSRNALQS
jgi:hypothetical protein